MMKMVIGLAVVCLDMPLSFMATILGYEINILIDLFPDVLGFILLLLGSRELSYENDFFYKNIKFSLWCATVAAMIFIMDLVGVTASGVAAILQLLGVENNGVTSGNGIQALLLQLLLVVLEPICLFRIVRAVRQVGKDYQVDVKGKLFLVVWIGYTVVTFLCFITFANYQQGHPLILVQSALSFAYTAIFFRFKGIYEEVGIKPDWAKEGSGEKEE